MRYLIDGYNLIFSLIDKDLPLQKLREQCIPLLSKFFQNNQDDVMIVFDGHASFSIDNHFERSFPFVITFSPKPLTADDYLIEIVIGTKEKEKLTLVSSDKQLLKRAKEFQTKTMTIVDFIKKKSPKVNKTSFEKTTPPLTPRHIAKYKTLFESKLENFDFLE